MALIFRYAARTDIGHARAGNEDSGYATPRLLAVADGVGGHAFGELASALTIGAIRDLDAAEPLSSAAAITAAVSTANERIATRVREDPKTSGMGTTLTVLGLFAGDRLGVVHIGDSRAYLYRDGELSQLSSDHTVLQELLDAGRLTPEQAVDFPYRNVVTRSMHGRPDAEPDIRDLAAVVGDRVMVCSDGLTDVVSPDEIGRVLGGATDADEAADTLLRLALDAGAPDNVTCLLADVITEEDAESEHRAETVGSIAELTDPG